MIMHSLEQGTVRDRKARQQNIPRTERKNATHQSVASKRAMVNYAQIHSKKRKNDRELPEQENM
jgi:hypothetical protein